MVPLIVLSDAMWLLLPNERALRLSTTKNKATFHEPEAYHEVHRVARDLKARFPSSCSSYVIE